MADWLSPLIVVLEPRHGSVGRSSASLHLWRAHTAWSFYDAAASLLLCRILLVLLLARLVVVLDQIALFQIGCCLLLGDVSDLSIGGVNGIGQVRE